MRQHYTMIKTETGISAGCSNIQLPDKVLEILGVELKESNKETCPECNEELEG